VIGVPPRRSFQRGMQDHLDDLLTAVEQANFEVVRDVLEFSGPKNYEALRFTDDGKIRVFRDKPVVVVDNLCNTGRTAISVARKLIENGATEANFCIMSRWIEGDTHANRIAKDYRETICAEVNGLYEWYRGTYCEPSS
jgi:hypothetical protein